MGLLTFSNFTVTSNAYMDPLLIEKYNQAVPRYTSYPSVPHWQETPPTQGEWIKELKESYSLYPELSLYIHLPFCEALCTYCGCNKRITKNHQVEVPYINSVLKEWKLYVKLLGVKPTIKEIHLGGGTPTFFDPKHIEYLIKSILNDADLAEDHTLSFEAHPNSTTYNHLQVLYNLGFNRISVGVQDVSPNILKAINRQQTSEEVAQVTQWARAIGYTSVNYDIIYGLPFQEKSNIFDTAQFIAQQRPDRIAFYSYAHVPWKSASQRAFTLDDVPSGTQKNDLYALGRYLLEMEGYKAVGMDHFCLPDESLYTSFTNGHMHRNFMGYTPLYTRCSIALGASSIGDSWSMYVQNEKQVERYQDLVNAGQLPIVKGHKLSHQEEHIRSHILDLMCKSYTKWERDRVENEVLNQGLTRLKDMADDGLLTYGENWIKLSSLGQYFVRNVCAAIDPIFQISNSTKTQFSKSV